MRGYPLDGNLSVMAMNHLVITGNVIPPQWFNHLKYENGRPHQNAAFVLSDTIYWHSPITVRDDDTGVVRGMRKRFKGDKLQRSYSYFALYGLSKKQAREAVDLLEGMGLMTREFRTVTLDDGRTLNNVMYLDIVPARIAEITVVEDDEATMTSLSAFLLSQGAEPPVLRPPEDDPKEAIPDDVLAVLDVWSDLFPDKPQPRRIKSSGQVKKLITRLKDDTFANGWRAALKKAAASPHLQKSPWFKFEYFVRNAENWQKIIDGVFDGFDQQYLRQHGQTSHNGSDKNARLEELGSLLSTYGRRGFREAEVAASFHLRPLVQQMSDLGWAGVCGLTEADFRVTFFTAYKTLEQAERIKELDR